MSVGGLGVCLSPGLQGMLAQAWDCGFAFDACPAGAEVGGRTP